MVPTRWLGFAILALAACGGTAVDPTNPTDGGGHDAQGDALGVDAASPDAHADGGGHDAQGDTTPEDAVVADAPGDAGYLACLSASGQLDGSLKTCQADTDCVIR
jgi:hypothetical protein